MDVDATVEEKPFSDQLNLWIWICMFPHLGHMVLWVLGEELFHASSALRLSHIVALLGQLCHTIGRYVPVPPSIKGTVSRGI